MTPLDGLGEIAVSGLFDPTFLAAAFTALLGLVGLSFERQRRQHRKLSKGIEETRHEVKNSHTTNLREDLDYVMRGVEKLLEGQERHDAQLVSHGQSIGGLRDDIRQERTQRMSDVDDLRADQRDNAKRMDKHLELANA